MIGLMKFALEDLWPLGLFLIMFLFTYTLIGKEWFAY